MRRLALASPVLALALALAPTPAAAQPAGTRAKTPTLSNYALMYLGDPALQKELKLSEAQVKKLDEQRDQLGALVPVDAAQREATAKALDKAFADILEPAQVKRLKQIVMQQLERGPIVVGAQVLAGTPEVAEGLKLTDEQKARITWSTRLTALLTADQLNSWKSLTGEPFETALQLRSPGVIGRAAVPASVQYLLQKSVADELKLSEAQSKKVAELRDRWQKESPNVLRTAEERKKAAAMTASLEKVVAGLLDAAQNKRLKQIALQQSLADGREAAVFAMPDAIKELKLTDGQDAKIKSIQEGSRKALPPLFLTGESSGTIAKKVEAHKKETYEQLLAVLNDSQRALLKELIGERFKGSIRLTGLFGSGGIGIPAALQSSIHLSISGVTFADSKPLHEELKLSEAQVKQLAELRVRTQARTLEIGPPVSGNEQYEKLSAEQAKDTEKALAEILQPQQHARLKQVILQYYARVVTGLPSPILGRLVEVSEGLKLTREQKDRLQQGEELARVLDEKQQARWKEMLGQPFAKVASLSTGSGLGGGRGQVMNAPLQYLNAASVREELKLTEGQIRKLPELALKWDELTGVILRTPPTEERARKMTEARAALDKAVAGVLDEKQVARLRQIELQQMPRSGQGTLLTAPEVRKGLDLSEDQVRQITAINQDAGNTRSLISRELLRVFDQRIDEDYTKTMQEFNKIANKKVDAVLTQVQRDKLRAMLGEPFKGEIAFGPFGGPGGFAFAPGGRPLPPLGTVILGVQIATEEGKGGALIGAVIENTPAAKAGLKAGDRIKFVGGKAVDDLDGVRAALAGFKGGDKAEIGFERDGKEEKVQVEFDAAAAPPAARTAPSNIKDDKVEPLAHFKFDGNAKNEGKGEAEFELNNTEFRDNALYINGMSELKRLNGKPLADAYRAVCSTPKMNYEGFAVALRFKAENFAGRKTNLFTGGRSHRWFGLERSPDGNLVVTLNNGLFKHGAKDAALEAGKWAVVACSVDVPGRKVVACLNGKKVATLDLPKDFQMNVVTSKAKDTDKVWTFTNHGRGLVFHGLVDELLIYGRALTADELDKIPLRP